MKKSLLFTMIALCSAIFVSCASLPKNVKPGDTLVIGRAEAYLHDYLPFADVDFTGRKLSGIEITIKEVNTGKRFVTKTNEDGCFIISRCKPGYSYAMETFKIIASGNSGARWVTLSFPNPRTFSAHDNFVVNLGGLYIDFDGKNNWATWEVKNHYYVKQFFEELDEESEWHNKEIIDLRS